jgi:nucleotide-binding universal stress UspA family protein
MYARVILADDGSAQARSAIPRTAALAAACGSEVLVVRVSRSAGVRPQDLDEDEWRRYVSPEGRADSVVAPLEAEPHLSEVVAALQTRGVQHVGSLVLHGDPADALVEAADELDADLLVISSRGESGLRRAVLGSVAEQLIREARKTAILLSPASDPEGNPQVHRVMVTLDGSEVSKAALPHAEYLAKALGVELVLFQVTDSEADLMAASTPVGVPPAPSISADAAQRVAAEQHATVEAELREYAAALRSRGLDDIVVEVISGRPSDAILDASDRLDVDLVVMATHGRGGLGRMLLGSVADSVTRNTQHAAVLLIRPDQAS